MSGAPSTRVLLIGWDAADWKVINPLIDAGKMPAMKALVEGGVMASPSTLRPVISPILWTSIATGKRPFKHGILGFTEPTPDGRSVRPITNQSRKVKAVWNILNETGLRTHVLGWWPSHPAEPIDGVMVSNHFQRAYGPLNEPWPLVPGSVHPPRLEEILKELRVHPNELTGEHILPFVPRAAEIDQEKDPRVAMVAKVLAECSSIHAAATWLMESEPWDFMAVYYDAIDHFCHGFMKYYPPRQRFISERDFELYSGVVEAAYRYHDMMLHRLLTLAGQDTTVILVSDHGFHPDHLRPSNIPHEPAGPTVEHRDFGVFVMRGPAIKKDEYAHGTTLLDVAPTVLTLFGLPVGEDMDGRPILEAYEDRPQVETISSWDHTGDEQRRLTDAPFVAVAAQEALKQLVALGYIEKLDADRELAVATTVREQRYNLARSYMDAGLHTDAAPILRELHDREPREYRFGLQLAMCYRALGQITELRTAVEELNTVRREEAQEAKTRLGEIAQDIQARKKQREERGDIAAQGGGGEGPEERPLVGPQELAEIRALRAAAQFNPYAVDYLMGFVNASEGRDEEALELLARAEKMEGGRPGLHIQIGETYLNLKRWKDAERAFDRALTLDPDNAHAHLGLCRSYLGQKRNLLAVEEGLRAVGLLYHYPFAHFCLGLALIRLRRLPRAIEALQLAVAQNPNFLEAHERLARLYEHGLLDPLRAETHRKLAEDIRGARRSQSRVAAPVEHSRVAPQAQSAKILKPADALANNVTPSFGSLVEEHREANGERSFVTIVTGIPRSGTSLLMQMLVAGGLPALTDGQRTADDDNPRGYFEYEAAKRLHHDRSWLNHAQGKTVKIVAQLLPCLPRDHMYRVIFIERDLQEVVASQGAMLKRQGRAGAAIPTDELSRAFAAQVQQVKHWLAGESNAQTLVVQHRDVVGDPQRAASLLNDFLGGGLDTAAMASAVDTTLYRQHSFR